VPGEILIRFFGHRGAYKIELQTKKIDVRLVAHCVDHGRRAL